MFTFNLLDLFSDRAKESIQNAAKYALDFRRNYIDTEHLLLGITTDDVVDRVLKTLGTDSESVRNAIEPILVPGNMNSQAIEISPRAKQVLELSVQASRNMRHRYVGPEHILIGLIEENEGLAAQQLKQLGITLEKVKKSVENIVKSEEQNKKEQSETPHIDKYSRDLTKLAKEGKIDPVIGRSDEVMRVIQILSRRKKNNPVLIGDPGVGKTAIAEGLALKIVSGNVPETLMDKRVLALDLGMMVAGAKFRGEFEERAMKVIDEARRSSGKVILFMDELHGIVGAGDKDGLDMSNIMKPPLARGELQVIGATTIDEYRKYIEKDGALERRFQPITVEEPTIADTIEILKGIRDKYESHHKIQISEEALYSAAELSERYINDRFLPDKAIDLIDEAASKLRLEKMVKPDDIRRLELEIGKLEQERESLTTSQNYAKAAELKIQIDQYSEELKMKNDAWMQVRGTGTPILKSEDIADVVSMITKIPVKEMNIEDKHKLLNIESELSSKIIGQEDAVKAVSAAIRRARAGLKNPKRPIASFLFLGPTGVGKTELAKVLADKVFGSENNLIRLDMSEYSEKFNVSKLIGSPPGYVGFDEGGQLTEKVRRNPYSLILLDEIEKADPEVFNSLLQILEDGRLTDSKGKTVSFKNCVIIATSNIGADIIQDYAKHGKSGDRLGFNIDTSAIIEVKKGKSKQITTDIVHDQKLSKWKEVRENVIDELDKVFKPEFINRLDEIIVFKPLGKPEVEKIVKLELEKLVQLVKNESSIEINIDHSLIQYVTNEGYSEEFGAREIRRVIQQKIENVLATEMIKDNLIKGGKYIIKVNEGKIVIEPK